MKHKIVLTFETKGRVKRKVLDEIAVAAFVQLEGLSDDYGVKYDNSNYYLEKDAPKKKRRGKK